jgi:hypothetical protein
MNMPKGVEASAYPMIPARAAPYGMSLGRRLTEGPIKNEIRATRHLLASHVAVAVVGQARNNSIHNGVACARFAMGRRHQLGQDAAGVGTALLSATRTQLQQLFFQCLHTLQSCPHFGQLLINQQINILTVFAWLIDKPQ